MTPGNLTTVLRGILSTKADVEVEKNIMEIYDILEHFNYF
jgi:hypothetical protein